MSYSLDNSDHTLPAVNGFAISKSDSDDLPHVTRWIWVGGQGDVALVTMNGDTVTLSSVPAGTSLPIAARQVLSTGTSASNMVGLY